MVSGNPWRRTTFTASEVFEHRMKRTNNSEDGIMLSANVSQSKENIHTDVLPRSMWHQQWSVQPAFYFCYFASWQVRHWDLANKNGPQWGKWSYQGQSGKLLHHGASKQETLEPLNKNPSCRTNSLPLDWSSKSEVQLIEIRAGQIIFLNPTKTSHFDTHRAS